MLNTISGDFDLSEFVWTPTPSIVSVMLAIWQKHQNYAKNKCSGGQNAANSCQKVLKPTFSGAPIILLRFPFAHSSDVLYTCTIHCHVKLYYLSELPGKRHHACVMIFAPRKQTCVERVLNSSARHIVENTLFNVAKAISILQSPI